MNVKEITRDAIKACEPPTRYELAKRLHTDWKTVNGYVKGEREPRGRRLLQLLQIAQDATKAGLKGLALAILAYGLFGAILPPQDAVAAVRFTVDTSTHYTKCIMQRWVRLLWGEQKNGAFAAVAV